MMQGCVGRSKYRTGSGDGISELGNVVDDRDYITMQSCMVLSWRAMD